MTAIIFNNPQPTQKMTSDKITWWEILKVVGNFSLTILAILVLPAINAWRKARKEADEAKKVAAAQLLSMVQESVQEQKNIRADMKLLNHDLVSRISEQGKTIEEIKETVKGNRLEFKQDIKDLHGRIDIFEQRNPIK